MFRITISHLHSHESTLSHEPVKRAYTRVTELALGPCVPGVQGATVDHIVDSAGRADDDVDAAFAAAENPLILTDVGATDASVTRHAHVVTQRHHHFLDLKGRVAKWVKKR